MNLKQTINTGLLQTTCYLILPDGRLVLCCRGNNHVLVFKSDGTKDFEINLNSSYVIDISFIPEDNTIAVTSGGDGISSINMINIESKKVSSTIKVKALYYGIVYNDSKFITCARDTGIHILKNESCYVFEYLNLQ